VVTDLRRHGHLAEESRSDNDAQAAAELAAATLAGAIQGILRS
jgi:hypothetical protein